MTNSTSVGNTTVSAAAAKAHLPELVARVEHTGARYIISRRGRPVAALVSVSDLACLEAAGGREPAPRSALQLLTLPGEHLEGEAARELDEAIDEMVAEIYAARDREASRPAPDFGIE